ncbi:MAG: ABC transporter ATP-binding protein [Pseudomonadota bacterium]
MDLISTSLKAFSLVDQRMRARWRALVPFAVVAALLESVGALLILGLIRLITDSGTLTDTPIAGRMRGYFSDISDERFLVYYAIVVALFYCFKNLVRFLEVLLRARAANETQTAVSSELLRRYLSAPYVLFLKRSSSELLRTTRESAHTLSQDVLSSATAIFSELLVLLGVIGILFYAAPGSTLIVCVVLAAVTVILLRATQSQFRSWGKRLHRLQVAIFQTLNEGFRGIKDIKILGREAYFAARFRAARQAAARIAVLNETIRVAPRLVVETLFVAGMVTVIVFAALDDQPRGEVLALLGLFAYALMRALPSVHLMVYHANNIRFGSAAVDQIHGDFEATNLPDTGFPDPTDRGVIELENDICLRGVSFSYPAAGRVALSDINLTIEAGRSLGIVGPTGAGKTTLVDLLLGLLSPDEGQVLVDGVDISGHLRSWQDRIGYVSQRPYLMDDSVRQNIALGLESPEIDEARVLAAVRAAQLEDFVAALPNGLNTKVGEAGVRLSGGEHQRIATARALYRNPDVLVFDEATSALDNATERALSKALAGLRGEKTMIIIAHRLSTVRNCDELVLLVDGRIADIGSYDELAQRNAHFREIAGLVEADA